MRVLLDSIRFRKCKLAVKASILGWLVSNWISYVLCEGGFCIQTVTTYEIMYLRYLFYTQLLQETRFLTFVTPSLHFSGHNS